VGCEQKHNVWKTARTEEYPSCQRMCVVAIWIGNVAHAEEVELFLAALSCSIDGEQDWPCNTAANKSDAHKHFQISDEEIVVE
jgi:hypothetical protein